MSTGSSALTVPGPPTGETSEAHTSTRWEEFRVLPGLPEPIHKWVAIEILMDHSDRSAQVCDALSRKGLLQNVETWEDFAVNREEDPEFYGVQYPIIIIHYASARGLEIIRLCGEEDIVLLTYMLRSGLR